MKVAIICSNYFNITEKTQNGTAIFNYDLITNLAKHKTIEITAFASGASKLPVPIESVESDPSFVDEELMASGKHFIFELALVAKALAKQNSFDLYHVNIGDGDIVLPFAAFIKKPILITLHHLINKAFVKKYFSLFKRNKNIFFISVSNAQRRLLPGLNYAATIYHGVDLRVFKYNPRGGGSIMWAGRAMPEKGPDTVVAIVKELKRDAKLFGILKKEHQDWWREKVVAKAKSFKEASICPATGRDRLRLVKHFQTSKLFLFPVGCEEAFGLVLIEAMSCGTPVVAFARGSVPEVIVDGETGFIVNFTDSDIRGDWIIKKTGVDGLREAVEKIYAMPEEDYLAMRKKCREHVKKYFSIEKMTTEYLEVYKSLTALSTRT